MAAMKEAIKKLKSEKASLATQLRDRPVVVEQVTAKTPVVEQVAVAVPSIAPLPAAVPAPPDYTYSPVSRFTAPPVYSTPAYPPTAPRWQNAVRIFFDRQDDVCNSYDNAIARDDFLELHQRHRDR